MENIKKHEIKDTLGQKKLAVYNSAGQKIEEVNTIFDGNINHQHTFAQVIKQYQSNLRTGLAATKTRGEISGGGRKPWRQKGTGRARVGSSRNPLWRHGGVVFGPHPRNHHYTLPPKIRNLALKQSLEEKNTNDELIVLDSLKLSTPKTNEIQKIIDNLKLKGNTLLVIPSYEKNIKSTTRNIAQLRYKFVENLNALDVVKAKNVILLQDTLETLFKRLTS